MGRELAREVEGLPARGIRADAGVDLGVAALGEAGSGARVVVDEPLQQLRVGHTLEPGDADGVEVVDRRRAARREFTQEVGDTPVETRPVVVLARGKMGDEVAERPTGAARRATPVLGGKRGDVHLDALRLGGHQLHRIELLEFVVDGHRRPPPGNQSTPRLGRQACVHCGGAAWKR